MFRLFTLVLLATLAFSATAFAQSAPRIAPGSLVDALCRPGLVLLDVRSPAAWEDADYMIFGAARLDPDTADLSTVASRFDRNKVYVLYDAAPAELVAEIVASRLIKYGVTTRILSGGFTPWFESGLPIQGRFLAKPLPGVTTTPRGQFPNDR